MSKQKQPPKNKPETFTLNPAKFEDVLGALLKTSPPSTTKKAKK